MEDVQVETEFKDVVAYNMEVFISELCPLIRDGWVVDETNKGTTDWGGHYFSVSLRRDEGSVKEMKEAAGVAGPTAKMTREESLAKARAAQAKKKSQVSLDIQDV